MMILQVLRHAPLHGYAIAQKIHLLSREELRVEEGSLYPALQKLLVNGWVKSAWTVSESGRKVREYSLTPAGRKQLNAELEEYERMALAVRAVLKGAAE
jgi:PadR family transcriptional regulator, regulatory protein PadR